MIELTGILIGLASLGVGIWTLKVAMRASADAAATLEIQKKQHLASPAAEELDDGEFTLLHLMNSDGEVRDSSYPDPRGAGTIVSLAIGGRVFVARMYVTDDSRWFYNAIDSLHRRGMLEQTTRALGKKITPRGYAAFQAARIDRKPMPPEKLPFAAWA